MTAMIQKCLQTVQGGLNRKANKLSAVGRVEVFRKGEDGIDRHLIFCQEIMMTCGDPADLT